MTRARDMANLGGSAKALGETTGKNLVINGAMQVAQRGTSFTPDTSLNYCLDRYATLETTDGDMTISQDTSVVPTGFKYSLKAVTGTADSSLASNQRMLVLTRLEGYNVSQLELGTANAKKFTLSFYVRSSLTGTFGGAFQNVDSDRNYPFTYVINSADTWERKTITITGDTTGTYNTTTGTGLQVCWGLGVGSDYSGTAGAWAAGDKNSATGAVSVIGTASATWYLTGVQVEVGETATDFDHRPFAEELNLCYRYFYKIIRTDAYGEFLVIRTYSTTQGTGVMILPVPMRVQPTFTSSSVSGNFSYGMSVLGFSTTDSGNASTSHRLATHNAVGAFTSGGAAVIQKANNSDAIFMQYDSEL
tara:strand:- start:855 stop:1940 length:1086 start_codon:yes stop_codon:yes gene_type:complete